MHPRKQELKPFKKFKNLTFIKTINTLGQLVKTTVTLIHSFKNICRASITCRQCSIC